MAFGLFTPEDWDMWRRQSLRGKHIIDPLHMFLGYSEDGQIYWEKLDLEQWFHIVWEQKWAKRLEQILEPRFYFDILKSFLSSRRE